MTTTPVPAPASDLLTTDLVRLDAAPEGKEDAIRLAAQLLQSAGCTDAAYADSMLRREAVANTFLGHGVVIPHGMGEDRHLVRRNGIAVLQMPRGVVWNDGQTAHLAVAIAAHSDAHITILRRLTRLIQDARQLDALVHTTDAGEIVRALSADAPVAARASGARPAGASPAGDLAERFEWTVAYPAGLHARPAARWVEAARASGARIQVRNTEAADPAEAVADAKSVIGLLQLGLRAGTRIVVSAEGRDADGALQRLRGVMNALVAQERRDADAAQRRAPPRVGGWAPESDGPSDRVELAGIGASPGLAIGTVHRLGSDEVDVPDEPVSLQDGGRLLDDAITATRHKLAALTEETTRRLGAAEAGIFKAQAALLDDTDLITLTCQLMVEGHGVAWSWHQAVDRLAGKLSALGNAVLAARAADLRDVGRQVLAQIEPALRGQAPGALPPDSVLLAMDLSPSDTALLDATRVAGLATVLGGPTSHSAILMRTLGLPALVAAGQALLDVADGTPCIIDGSGGRLHLNPSAADLASAGRWIAAQSAQRAREAEERRRPAVTTDGHRIDIAANVNLPDQVADALGQGAEGVGLMRTEFLFLERGTTPSEDEQYAIYAAMAAALDGRPLIVRTLDIGGDKQVPHLDLPVEDNPFLGVRGARLLLRRTDLLTPQLRALYRAAKDGAALWIMFPMITSVPEIVALRRACDSVRAELEAPEVPLGIMVEVPAAALLADVLARHSDFFSIGTNDLAQYTLAIDRQNPELAAEGDSLHPAVLRLVQRTVAGAARHKRWVGVCGGLAGDPLGAALLAGLGVDELSMTPRDIAAVKARLRASSLAGLQALAERAMACETPADVRALDGGAAP